MKLRNSALASAAAIAALAILLGVGLHAPSRAFAAGPCLAEAPALGSEELAFLGLLNDFRVRNGVQALQPSVSLRRAAYWHANQMAAKNYFSHTDDLGRHAVDRARDCGYPFGVGENISAGTESDSAAEAFAQFLGSPPHRTNMLDVRYRVVGIARALNVGSTYTWYWDTDFGDAEEAAAPARLGLVVRGPLWVNDLAYGNAGGGFYWDPATNQVWTGQRKWHAFSPSPSRNAEPLWVDDLSYGSASGGYYLDPSAGQVWTAERRWHTFARS